LVKGAAPFAALLLCVPAVWAGGGRALSNPAATLTPSYSTAQRTPTPVVRVVSRSVTLSVVANPPSPAQAPLKVTLRGPDGQARNFSVEGGTSSIEYPRTVVIRPGQSVTLRWVAAK